MDITLQPGKLQGTIAAIPSKSAAHRMLICAAFADGPTRIHCAETSADIEATVQCLQALGATIVSSEAGYWVEPATRIPPQADLYCKESGSTLRFLLPVVGALGVSATFHMESRLAQRPLSPLWEEMERMGCRLTRPTADSIQCCGQLRPGAYAISGQVSSQFISGLHLAFPLMDGPSTLEITEPLQSKPYVDITVDVLNAFQPGRHSPGELTVEGDWSNAAFWLAAQALGSPLDVTGLDSNSPQGDRVVTQWLPRFVQGPVTLSAAHIPDLVPILAVVAAANQGATFTGIARLRFKESDRVASTIAMIQALGGKAEASRDTLRIYGTGLQGGIVDACNDHRIAMSAAIASTVCREPVTILGCECVQKSYPKFWQDLQSLK